MQSTLAAYFQETIFYQKASTKAIVENCPIYTYIKYLATEWV